MSAFSISTAAWITSGAASAGSTTFATVGAGYLHGEDADGKHLEHDGTAGTNVANPIAESLVSTFLGTAGEQTYRHTFGLKITPGDGSAAAAEFNIQFFWFSGFVLWLRHVTADARTNADGSVSHIRLYTTTTGTAADRNSTGYVFIPTDRLLRVALEAQETAAGVFTFRVFINGELVNTAAGVAVSNAFAARIVEFRLGSTGTASKDCRVRLYGDFTGEENPAALLPDASAQVSPGVRALPVPLDAVSGWWAASGGVAPGADIDDLNGGGGVPQIPLRTATIPSGGELRTRDEVGTIRTNARGSGALVFPAVVVNDGTARLTVALEAPGGASTLLALRFDNDGRLKHAAGSGALFFSNLLDQDGSPITWTAGEVYELAVHFAPGKNYGVFLHRRSATFAGDGATATVWAGSAAGSGVPTLGDLVVSGALTGSSAFAGAFLTADHWLGLVSSWVHSTGSPYGGGAHLLEPVNRLGFGMAWGNELPGLEPDGDRPNELAAVGRSGADLADWETTNPAWSDLLPRLSAARLYFADTMVNHLVAQRINGAAAIATARDEVLAQVGRVIDAAKAAGVAVDFMAQQPLPTGGVTSYPAEITAACAAVNAGIEAALAAAGRPDLFTWAPVTDGLAEADFYDAADDTHYDAAGDELAYLRSYTERAPIGTLAGVRRVASSTRRRRR